MWVHRRRRIGHRHCKFGGGRCGFLQLSDRLAQLGQVLSRVRLECRRDDDQLIVRRQHVHPNPRQALLYVVRQLVRLFLHDPAQQPDLAANDILRLGLLVDQETQAKNIVRGQVRLLRGIVQKEPDKLPDNVKKSLARVRVNMLPPDNELVIITPAFEPDARENLTKLRQSIAELKKTAPPAPEFAMAMADTSTPVNPHVLVRGNPNNAGPDVPRQFLAILSPQNRKPFSQGSGRLELAEDIASKDNPLT